MGTKLLKGIPACRVLKSGLFQDLKGLWNYYSWGGFKKDYTGNFSDFLVQASLIVICNIKGHDFIETDADPENGASEIVCKRCGWSQSIFW